MEQLGIVTDMDDDRKKVQVVFCVHDAIIHKWITRQIVMAVGEL